ncbi:hypothetical protein NpNSSI1_00012795 [Neofusicoccum parvum]|uniref:Uncharacterized protein n=2 Tax=Neofusicoccum parvum TaxID=310453 RepID=R1EHY9_BOTPV|nr:hypothetical protein UCRNP2_6122 [Neofusicoccum parvum UCRNP2]GME23655.1 hypothetical protein NpPPO83_00008198 [Neofusicoccum parvum]GME56279.1 hypothetical protein NpNSSI1_00012795 [Neofusicoccum parvum]
MSNIIAISVQGNWPMEETQTAPSQLGSFRDTNSHSTVYCLNPNVSILGVDSTTATNPPNDFHGSINTNIPFLVGSHNPTGLVYVKSLELPHPDSGSPVLDELFAFPALSLIKITVVLRGLPLQINNICSVYVPNSSGLTVRSVGRAVMDTIERVEGESCFQIFLRVW